MSRKSKERDVCNDQTNVDYWISLGPDWLQRIMESPGGRLESIFEVPEEKADVGQSTSLYGQVIFSRGIRQ
jgi:hypothetical protein